MFKKAKVFFMIVETPLHVGSGSDLGIVDLPIQRERPTGFPKIEASGIKGCIREVFDGFYKRGSNVRLKELEEKFPALLDVPTKKDKYEEAVNLIFGPEKSRSDDMHAGALGFTNARILLFPVRSVKGVFSWITCPAVLHRFANELKLTGFNELPLLPGKLTVPVECDLKVHKGESIILEEYRFVVSPTEECSELANWLANRIYPAGKGLEYWQDKLKKSLVVLEDDDFCDFVNHSTEVVTRIKIDPKTGTVQKGALFTEEYLPQETIMYSIALASPIFVSSKGKGVFAGMDPEEEAVMNFWEVGMPDVIQLGGNSTIGKGLVRINTMI